MPRGANHSANWGGARPGAGRPKGSLSRMTQYAINMVEGANEHPLEVLLRIANDRDIPPNIQAQAAAHCLPYCVSRLAAAEPDAGKPTDHMSMDELESHVELLQKKVQEANPDVIDAEVIEVVA